MNTATALVPPQPGEDPVAAVARIKSLSVTRLTPCGSGNMVWNVWGQGTPLILLHGGFGSWLHWIRNIAALAGRFTVLAATFPGFGDSDDLPDPHTAEHIAAIVSAGIDRLLPPGQRFHILGFSFGGIIGGIAAALQGDRLISLTLSGTGGMGLPRNHMAPLQNWRRAETEQKRLRIHRRNLEIIMMADPRNVDDLAVYVQDRNTSRCRVRTYKYWHLNILGDWLYKVKGRLMGIYGSRDAISSGHLNERIDYLSAVQPNLIFREIEGAGHWVCYEAADVFNKTYFEIVKR